MTEHTLGNDDGTVCCICGKPIVFGQEPHHGAYDGDQAWHYDCHVRLYPPFDSKKAFADLDNLQRKAQDAVDRVRRSLQGKDY